jgi:hypothetical protein
MLPCRPTRLTRASFDDEVALRVCPWSPISSLNSEFGNSTEANAPSPQVFFGSCPLRILPERLRTEEYPPTVYPGEQVPAVRMLFVNLRNQRRGPRSWGSYDPGGGMIPKWTPSHHEHMIVSGIEHAQLLSRIG